jgi:hypothetical protein
VSTSAALLWQAVDNSGRSSLQELLDAVMLAERASSSGPGELPLGQWEVEALRGRADLLPPQLLQASPAQSARKLSVEALAGMTDVLVMSGEHDVSGSCAAAVRTQRCSRSQRAQNYSTAFAH